MKSIAATHLVIYSIIHCTNSKSPFIWSLQTDIVKSALSDDFSNGRHLLKNNQIILPITGITDVHHFHYVLKYCSYLIHTFCRYYEITQILIFSITVPVHFECSIAVVTFTACQMLCTSDVAYTVSWIKFIYFILLFC